MSMTSTVPQSDVGLPCSVICETGEYHACASERRNTDCRLKNAPRTRVLPAAGVAARVPIVMLDLVD